MKEFDFKDTFNCDRCYGDGYLNLVNYSNEDMRKIAIHSNSYLLAGYPNRLFCTKCNGLGKIKDLELEPTIKHKE